METETTIKGWERAKISDITVSLKAGGTPRKTNKAYWNNGDIPFAMIEDLTRSKMYLSDTRLKISKTGLENSSAWVIPEGHVLLSMYATIGKAVINKIKMATNQAILAIETNEKVLPEFLVYSFEKNKNRLISQNVQSTQKNVNKSIVENFEINFPKVNEQKAIVQALTTVQDAITGQENLISKLKELKRSMMQHLFTHGTKGEKTKMMEISEVPESWNEVEIGSLGQVVTGSTPSTKIEKYYSPLEIDFISPGDISYGKYVYSTVKQISKAGFGVSRPIPKNAICCVCIGSSIGKVAKAYRESTSNQQINSIICNDHYDSDFVYYLMSFYSDTWRGHATFGPVPLLSKGSFSSIKIPVSADIMEQRKIARILANIEESIEIAEATDLISQSLFKTLLHELMSGERRIKNI